MLKIGCKDSYNVLHINNEIGQICYRWGRNIYERNVPLQGR